MPRELSAGIRSLQVWPERTEAEILRAFHLSRLIKMASNENCYGCSPQVYEAIRNLEMHRYPELQGGPLKEAIAVKFGVASSQVLIGNGSSEIIQMIAQTYLSHGEECITALETFPVYSRCVRAMDANCMGVPLKSDIYNLQGMMDSMTVHTRLMFVANPNNPTGTCVSEGDLRNFLDTVPANVIVVLDEAYKEYQEEAVDTIPWLSRYPNLILLRTFSKVHGLAGLRIGYAFSSAEIIAELHRVRLPYTVSRVAQAAAIAALQDSEHVSRCVERNHQQRTFLQTEFAKRGYPFVPSQTNFILLKRNIADALLRRGILVAPMGMFHMLDAVRITLGTPEENAHLLNGL